MKILQLLHNHKAGGAERHLLALCEGLRERGHQVDFAGAARSWVGQQLAERGFAVHDFDFRGHFDLPAALRLLRLLRREHYDLAHTHLVRAAFYAKHVAPLAATPLTCSVHDLLTWRHYPRSAPLIAVSQAVRSHLAGHGFADASIEVIYPGARDCGLGPRAAELRAQTRASLGLDEATAAIGLIGRVAEVKAHDVAIAAAARLAALTRRPFRLFFIGAPTGWGTELQARCREPRIEWLGARSDIPELLAALDLCIQPSRSEGMPLALMEAASAAKPVVATHVGGVPEIIRDGASGLLVPAGSAEALAAAMAALLDDPARARALGETLHARFAGEFSLPVMVERTLASYRRLQAAG